MTKKEIEIAFKRWRADAKRRPQEFVAPGKTTRSDYEVLRHYSKKARW